MSHDKYRATGCHVPFASTDAAYFLDGQPHLPLKACLGEFLNRFPSLGSKSRIHGLDVSC